MNDTPKKDRRTVKLAQLFAEAGKRGIDQDELRNVIAPGVIGHRLSEATVGEIIEVIRHIGGVVSSVVPRPSSLDISKDRFSDLGFREGMATPAQLRKIEAMWMGVSKMPNYTAKERALKGFLKRITGVEELRFIESWQVQKIIRALGAMK
jgi:hypothetical protein